MTTFYKDLDTFGDDLNALVESTRKENDEEEFISYISNDNHVLTNINEGILKLHGNYENLTEGISRLNVKYENLANSLKCWPIDENDDYQSNKKRCVEVNYTDNWCSAYISNYNVKNIGHLIGNNHKNVNRLKRHYCVDIIIPQRRDQKSLPIIIVGDYCENVRGCVEIILGILTYC